MLIGLDVDEVLAETIVRVIERHNDVYCDEKKYKREDFTSYNWSDVWGGTREDSINEIYDFVASEYHDRIEPKKWAVEGVKRLSKHHDLVAVTGRSFDFEEKTRNWLGKYFGDMIDGVCFGNDYSKNGEMINKSHIAKELGLELFVEDNFSYANDIAKVGTKVFLFNAPWNQDLPDNGVQRVYSWYDIVEKLGYMY
jgi:uncharacterized protein